MGRNWAIAIGINQYDNLAPLYYAKRDAAAMRDYFCSEAGFEQVYYFADDAPDIEQGYGPPFKPLPTFAKLDRFLDVRFEQPFLRAGDNFWFFFAGHGKRHRNRDYLLPSDVNPRNIEGTAIPIHYVTERLRRCGADNVILLLDACRNEGDRDGEGIGLETQQGVVTLFSCSPNERSYEIDALQQGAFTHALLQGLRLQGEGNCATVERLYQHLRYYVPQLSQQYQKPRQTPYGIIEPPTKNHLILLPRQATLSDINTLKAEALRAEVKRDYAIAKQLWIRVLAVSPADPEAIEAIERLAHVAGGSAMPVPLTVLQTSETGTRGGAEQRSQVARSMQQRVRPLHPGLAIGHFRGGYGTLGCFVRKRGQSDIYILSTSDVVALGGQAQVGDAILQPATVQGGTQAADRIATFQVALSPQLNQVNTVDAALAFVQPSEAINPAELPGIGTIQGVYQGEMRELSQQAVAKLGARSGVTWGTITGTDRDLEISHGPNRTVHFSGLIQITGIDEQPFSQSGDSGALIVDATGMAIALLFASGTAGGTPVTYGIPLVAILNALELELVVDRLTEPSNRTTVAQTSTFEFETVTVDARGQVVQREQHQNEYRIEDLGNGVVLELVKLPAGHFEMGAPDEEIGRSDNEGPLHSVTVRSFFMGKYPVTQAQWKVVAALPKVDRDLEPDPSEFKGDVGEASRNENRPVEQVSWDEAIEFCKRLSTKTGREYRLPTEAEWEYACRAGTATPFHFGETITPDLANYKGNVAYGSGFKGTYRERTMDVGSFPPNALGLYDMHGNVWEWCLDHWHERYEGAPSDGSAWTTGGNNEYRLLRGGSWCNYSDACRSALRGRSAPGIRNGYFGFRVVCSSAWDL
ncbi:MAG: hypothetical protein Kow00121_30470 [Elainellaceae cyanobacterium]